MRVSLSSRMPSRSRGWCAELPSERSSDALHGWLPVGLGMQLLLCVLTSLVIGCGGSSQRAVAEQEHYSKELTPVRLKPRTEAYKEATRTARIRVFATPQHQAQNLRWREGFADQIDEVNQYLVPAFGLRLEVVDSEPWPADKGALEVDDSAALVDILTALERLDDGSDVDWVVGLASALTAGSASFAQLGVARPLGRHIVLRGFSDFEAEPILAKLNDARRPRVRELRRQHRQAAQFLHEWAHSLGALHVDLSDALMATAYSPKVTGFKPEVESLVRDQLAARLGAQSHEQAVIAMARVLKQRMGTNPWQGWLLDELEMVQQQTEAVLARAKASGASKRSGKTSSESGSGFDTLPKEAESAFQRVQALAGAGDHNAALAELEPLIAAYPAHIVFRMGACQLTLQRDGPGPQAKEACGRVAEVNPDQLDGEFLLATALIKTDERKQAGEVLAGVRERIPRMSDPAAGWQRLVTFYRGINAVTWTEQAVSAAPSGVATDETAAWAIEIRRRYGLAPDSARRHRIKPADEGAYLQAVRTTIETVYRGDYAAAQKQARQALKRYRNAPGLHGALCDLELRRKRYPQARQHCQSAVRGYDKITWARYLLGILELRARKNAAGIRHLERAIELDPGLRQAWHALYQAYGRTRAKDKQQALGQAYQSRFGVAIPR